LVALIVTERLPWDTATVETRTAAPITTVPGRSFSTTRAPRSGSISSFSTSAMKPTTSPA
jgi:hypothetical protein